MHVFQAFVCNDLEVKKCLFVSASSACFPSHYRSIGVVGSRAEESEESEEALDAAREEGALLGAPLGYSATRLLVYSAALAALSFSCRIGVQSFWVVFSPQAGKEKGRGKGGSLFSCIEFTTDIAQPPFTCTKDMDSKGEGKSCDLDFGIDAKGLGSSPAAHGGGSRGSSRAESKAEEEDFTEYADSKGADDLARIDVVRVDFGEDGGRECPVDASLQLRIVFELDRDVIAGYWEVKFLVDSCDARIVKVLGETAVEDFPEGESDIFFTCPSIDLSGIPPSALTNSGLLIAAFMADGKEVAAVNCVVNVFKGPGGGIVREILNPLG